MKRKNIIINAVLVVTVLAVALVTCGYKGTGVNCESNEFDALDYEITAPTSEDCLVEAESENVFNVYLPSDKGGSINLLFDSTVLDNTYTYTGDIKIKSALPEGITASASECVTEEGTFSISSVLTVAATGDVSADYTVVYGPNVNGEYYESKTDIEFGSEANITLNIHVVDYINHLGDIDGNETVTLADAMRIFRYVAKLDVLNYHEFRLADMDRNGEVTLSDAMTVFYMVAKLG